MGWNPIVYEAQNITDVPPYIYQPSPLIAIRNQLGSVPNGMMEEMMPVSQSPLLIV
jgi:hypothetical protein